MATLDDLSVDQLNALYAQKTDPNVAAIHSIESGGASATANPVNPASGASGSMQTMPATSAKPGFGVKPSNGTPVDNTRTGVEYYQTMLKRYNDPVKAAVAYDWGPGNADKWIAGGSKLDDLPLETLQYIQKFDQHTGAISKRGAPTAPEQAPVAATATPAPAANAPAAAQAVPQQAPAPAEPRSFGQELLRQAGLFARAAGHGIANAAGVVANPVNALINTAGNAVGLHPGLKDVDTLLGNSVNQVTPAPAPGLESNINEAAAAVGNPINMATAGIPTQGIAQTALMGALGAANQPVHGDTDLTQYAGQVATGGAAGGALGALGRIFSPATSPAVQRLRAEGIQPSAGQMGGRLTDKLEAGSTSVPFTGEAVKVMRERADTQLNRAVYARALADVPNTVVPDEVGRVGIRSVRDQLQSSYDTLLPQMHFNPDQQFVLDMAPAAQIANELPPTMARRFTNILDDTLMHRIPQQGVVTGDAMKEIESTLTTQIKDHMGPNASVDEMKVGRALQATQQALRNAIQRQNPAQAPTLQAINRGWSVYSVLRKAGSMATDPDAGFTPAQFQQAVKMADKSQGQGRFATGTANLQQLADDARQVLGRRTPDSGTPGRNAILGLIAGGGAAMTGQLPTLGSAMIGQAAYATRPVQSVLRGLIADRPDALRAIGNGLPRGAGILGGIATPDQGTQP